MKKSLYIIMIHEDLRPKIINCVYNNVHYNSPKVKWPIYVGYYISPSFIKSPNYRFRIIHYIYYHKV